MSIDRRRGGRGSVRLRGELWERRGESKSREENTDRRKTNQGRRFSKKEKEKGGRDGLKSLKNFLLRVRGKGNRWGWNRCEETRGRNVQEGRKKEDAEPRPGHRGKCWHEQSPLHRLTWETQWGGEKLNTKKVANERGGTGKSSKHYP